MNDDTLAVAGVIISISVISALPFLAYLAIFG
jgi:hypothetical protein